MQAAKKIRVVARDSGLLMHWSRLNREVEPYERLTALIFGFLPAQLVYLMARLRLADLVADGSMRIEELSSVTEARPTCYFV